MNSTDVELPPQELDPIAQAILDFLCLRDPKSVVKPVEIAKYIVKKRKNRANGSGLWRRYLPAVRNQAKFLARNGRILIIRRGKPADPNTVKGLVYYQLVEPTTDE